MPNAGTSICRPGLAAGLLAAWTWPPLVRRHADGATHSPAASRKALTALDRKLVTDSNVKYVVDARIGDGGEPKSVATDQPDGQIFCLRQVVGKNIIRRAFAGLAASQSEPTDGKR
jgi:hypothetical protein